VSSRLGCALALVGLFLAGFVGVGAVLLLRAPGPSATASLGDSIVPPPGYVRLDDGEAGAGGQSAGSTATLLGVPSVPGYQDAVLRAWGRAPDQPSRAVVVLLVRLASDADATALRDAYVRAATSRGAVAFGTPEPLRGLREPADEAGRFAQRVVVARGVRLYVVSVVTPTRETDTSEVVRLALAATGSTR
jgi:hypothetical protein